MSINDTTIYSITQLNQRAKKLLESELGLVWLTGEISNFSQPVSGHWYLTLKDENSQVRCAMFRMKNLRVTFQPQNGMQVLVRANVSLYEPRGDYQLIIDSMQPAGEGLLQQKFDALKIKLAAEGLFAQNLKKKLPHFVQKVGVITSKTGAALQDILNILKRRDPSIQVIIYPTAVQGKDAILDIVQAITVANLRQEVDVLIVGRGGGSLEDLWCFNEEQVARAIFNSTLPIISAVGHETDITIADFVADVRAPTPSAAAEMVSRDRRELLQQIIHSQQRLGMAFDRSFGEKIQYFSQIKLRLQNQHPQKHLHSQMHYLQQLKYRLNSSTKYLLERKRHHFVTCNTTLLKNPLRYRLQQEKHSIDIQTKRLYNVPLAYSIQKEKQYLLQLYAKLKGVAENGTTIQAHKMAKLCVQLDGLSPLKTLSRGYSILENQKGTVIKKISQVNVGAQVNSIVSDGIIISRVEKLQHK